MDDEATATHTIDVETDCAVSTPNRSFSPRVTLWYRRSKEGLGEQLFASVSASGTRGRQTLRRCDQCTRFPDAGAGPR